ncbi:protein of unknown function [Microbacterium sp. Nx66]|nr:protein of unknown function [Microbacterium sp. Nx66]
MAVAVPRRRRRPRGDRRGVPRPRRPAPRPGDPFHLDPVPCRPHVPRTRLRRGRHDRVGLHRHGSRRAVRRDRLDRALGHRGRAPDRALTLPTSVHNSGEPRRIGPDMPSDPGCRADRPEL